jgi:hypothetical protein
MSQNPTSNIEWSLARKYFYALLDALFLKFFIFEIFKTVELNFGLLEFDSDALRN